MCILLNCLVHLLPFFFFFVAVSWFQKSVYSECIHYLSYVSSTPNKLGYIFLSFFLAVWRLHCCTQGFSSFGKQGLLLWCAGRLLIAEASLVAEHGLQGMQASVAAAHGLSSWQLQDSRVQAQQFWHMACCSLRHVGSSQVRDQTPVSCTGMQTVNHSLPEPPGEAQDIFFKSHIFQA